MVTDGGALAVSMMEAAVRAAVQAGAPRRTVAATAAAVASAMASRQNGNGEGGAATEPSAESQRRKKRYQKKKDRRKAAKDYAMHNAQADGLDLGDRSQIPCADLVEPLSQVEDVTPAPPTDVKALFSSYNDSLQNMEYITSLVESIERTDVYGAEVDSFLHSFSAMGFDNGLAVIKGMRNFREGTSPPRYRHLSDVCNLLIVHESSIREPGDYKASMASIMQKKASWQKSFTHWAKDGRRP